MNKTSIEWADYTSNPVTGKCPHACPYCYAERIRIRYKKPEEMAFHPERLKQIEKRSNPTTIFMGSMFDLFAKEVPGEWLQEIENTIKRCPQHTFLFLTKNTKRYIELGWHHKDYANVFLGETVTNGIPKFNHFISAEPLMGPIHEVMLMSSIIIGAMTGPGAKPPKKHWVGNIIYEADKYGVKVFLKDNILKLFPDLPRLRELPWKLHTK